MKYIINNVLKTNVVSVKKDNNGVSWILYFNGTKAYPCKSYLVETIIKEEEINLKENFVKINNKYIDDIKKIIYLKSDKKEYYNILKDGWKLYPLKSITIIKNALIEAKSIFEYINEILYFMKCNEQKYDKIITDSLQKNIELIKSISPDLSLYNYLIKEEIETYNEIDYIFPFRTNISQISAVKNVFKNKISVIDGPPGCGKTQTILNVIANAVYNEKTVAVVSSNNSAVENILEKLKKSDLDFICAKLGNKENENIFLNNQPEYPKYLSEKTDVKHIYKLQSDISKCISTFELNNELSILKMNLLEYKKEYENFILENKINYKVDKIKISLKKIIKVINKIDNKKNINKELNKFMKTIYFISCKNNNINKLKTYKEVLLYYKVLFYEVNIINLNKSIKDLNNLLSKNKINDYEEVLYNDSRRILNNKLKTKYNILDEINERIKFDNKYKENIIKEYPVILSTTHSINSVIKNYKYDYVIVDESSQVNIINGILAMSVAKNIVFVGDLKQLDSVISNKNEIKNIGNKYNFDENYKLEDNNILKSIVNVLPDVKRTLLKEHYRCHPKIIDFCNKTYYNNELIIYTENNDEDVFKVFLTPEGNHCRENSNQRELDIILNEINIEKYNDVGIIAPYNKQIELIRNSIDVEVDTIHKFQGREKECIIFSTVDNIISNFVDNPNLINVAVSRAIKEFILVTNQSVYNKQSNIRRIVDYVNYNNFEIVNSNVHSIFDLLYKCCNEKRIEYLKDSKLNTIYDSEKLFNILLLDVLKLPEFSHLYYCFQYPLLDVVKNISLLDDDLFKYASNRNTKIDFLLYNKLNKKPVLAIEVNGTNFHKKGSKQYYRDIKKAKVLELFNVNLLTLSTDGSEEREVLIKKLRDIIDL